MRTCSHRIPIEERCNQCVEEGLGAAAKQKTLPAGAMADVNTVLHIIRNPWGWSEDSVRAARLAAADEIERLKAELERYRQAVPADVEKAINKYFLSAIGFSGGFKYKEDCEKVERELKALIGAQVETRKVPTAEEIRDVLIAHGFYTGYGYCELARDIEALIRNKQTIADKIIGGADSGKDE